MYVIHIYLLSGCPLLELSPYCIYTCTCLNKTKQFSFFLPISVTLLILFLFFTVTLWGAYLRLAEVKWVKTGAPGVKPLLGVKGGFPRVKWGPSTWIPQWYPLSILKKINQVCDNMPPIHHMKVSSVKYTIEKTTHSLHLRNVYL